MTLLYFLFRLIYSLAGIAQALSVQLKTSFKITDFKIYRIFPSGEVQYLHPKDGVVPEKVNAGRVGVGNVSHSIGKNLNPSQIKFTTKSFSD